MEESEKATSCQKSNPGHLACAPSIQAWYKPAVLGSNHGDCRPFHFLLLCLKASLNILFQCEASRSYLPARVVQPAECLHCRTPTASVHPVHIQDI